MDKIKSKWEFLLQYRPDVRGKVGNVKLIGGQIGHNEMTDQFKSKLQIR